MLQFMGLQTVGHDWVVEQQEQNSKLKKCWPIPSVQFSRSVMSDTLWPHRLQHARLLCPSLSPGICLNICPLIQWCHPTISSSAAPFSYCPQSFPASGSFPMSHCFVSDGESIGPSALAEWILSKFSPSKEYSGLIFFTTDLFNLLNFLFAFEYL